MKDWKLVYSGKVRELYIPQSASDIADAGRLLLVASDRVSAFDHVLEPEIPGKGAVLTALSRWWCEHLDGVAHHLTPESPPLEIADRAMVALPLEMFPVECVVRGYLAGSGWKEYQTSQTVGGVSLPSGLSEGDALPEVLFTPATKAELGDHDENITFDQMADIVSLDVATRLKDLSVMIYSQARAIGQARGLIVADTKFEFGRHPTTGEITLGDEVLTSDSSRYWDAEIYAKGGIGRLDSFDKQLIRNWLLENWSGEGTPPTLPAELVALTQARYAELFERLTGQQRETAS